MPIGTAANLRTPPLGSADVRYRVAMNADRTLALMHLDSARAVLP